MCLEGERGVHDDAKVSDQGGGSDRVNRKFEEVVVHPGFDVSETVGESG